MERTPNNPFFDSHRHRCIETCKAATTHTHDTTQRRISAILRHQRFIPSPSLCRIRIVEQQNVLWNCHTDTNTQKHYYFPVLYDISVFSNEQPLNCAFASDFAIVCSCSLYEFWSVWCGFKFEFSICPRTSSRCLVLCPPVNCVSVFVCLCMCFILRSFCNVKTKRAALTRVLSNIIWYEGCWKSLLLFFVC